MSPSMAAARLAGGHIAANVNNPNENLGQWQAGAMRPLCVFAPQRMEKSAPIHDGMGWHDIPTCKEQGLNIESYQMPRTVWVPADVPAEAVAFYREALKQVAATPAWQDYLAAAQGCVVSPVDGDQPSLRIGLASRAEVVGLEVIAAGKSSDYDFVFDPATGIVTSNGQQIAAPGLIHWLQPQGRSWPQIAAARTGFVAVLPQRAVPDLCELTVVANAARPGRSARAHRPYPRGGRPDGPRCRWRLADGARRAGCVPLPASAR